MISAQLSANPTFLAETPTQQAATLNSAFTTLELNTTTILTQVHTALPQARLVLLDYYNPYVSSTYPNPTFDTLAATEANAEASFLQTLAPAVGGKFVDIYAPFVGHESAYTYISSGSVHPNGTGYGVIASQIEGQAFVPEPNSLAALLFGALSLGGLLLRRRFVRTES